MSKRATRSEIIERDRKIAKDYANGLSFEKLSAKYNVCIRTCYRALNEEKQIQRITKEQTHAKMVSGIVAEYQKNTSINDISEKYGISPGYCSSIVVQAGISDENTRRHRTTLRQQKRNEEIFEKYQNGIDAKDLAKAYHYSLPGIYSIIRRVREQKQKRA